jgi:hypothetical protein
MREKWLSPAALQPPGQQAQRQGNHHIADRDFEYGSGE